MSKLVKLQRREQSSDGVNWYPLDTYRVAYVIEEESNCQDDDIVYTKWVNTSEFECENGTKHFLAKKQLSYDNQSWFDANPIEYRRNGITVSGAWECQGIEPTAPYSRLVETDLWECGDNYTKHYLSERQFSYDNIEWFSYIPKKYEWDATRTEYYSKDCGYMPPKEQSVHLYFTDGTEDWVFHPYSYIEPHYYDGINGIYGRNDIEKVEIGQMLIRIDEYAFANQPNLKEAYFEDYVIDSANNIFFGDQMLCKVNDNPRGTLRLNTEVLGNGAFNYTAFDTIILDEGNKSIGVSTFASMGNLTSVTLPSTVETISGSAFYNCFSLDNIDIAATTPPQIEFDTFLMVKEYGKLGFPNGSDYSQWLSFDEFYLGYYHWRERIGDYDVKLTFQDGTTRVDTYSDGVIPTSAYTSGSTIVAVDVGEGITSIDQSAFRECSSLTSITLPNSVTSIGDYAFRSCTSLTNIDLPNCTTVGSDAFYYCSSLTSVNLPNCTSVGNGAFANCSSLTSVNLPNCTTIGDYAFSGCLSLTSITIPNSVTSIGSSAFYYCTSLTSVTYNGVTYEYRQDIEEALTANGVTLGTNVFEPSALKERLGYYDVIFTLTDGTTRTNNYEESGGVIPDNRYINNTLFTKVEFGDGIVSIGSWAFKNCSNCSEYIFSPTSRLTTIGDWCFESSFKYKKDYVFEVPNGVTSIGNGAFYNSGLARITLPSGLTVIDENTFNRCNLLDDVVIPSSVKIIKSNAFKECGGLRNINLSNVEQLWSYAFEKSGLETINLPESLQFVGDYCFLDCNNLNNVDLGGCQTIYTGGFCQCPSLESIDLKNVTSLKYGAFWGCSSLTSVTMNEITDIEHQIFNLCSKLVEIHYLGTTLPTTLTNTFEGIGENGTLYHPNVSDASQWLSTDEYYLGYYGWKDGNIPPTPPLGDYDVRTTVTVAEGVVETNVDTFESGIIPYNYLKKKFGMGTIGVKSVEIGNRITTIGQSAFQDCSSLTNITIPSSVTSIGDGAFDGCSNLNKIHSLATTPPTITNTTFRGVKRNGTLYHTEVSNYSQWLSTDEYYLGYYGWNIIES